MNTCWRQRVTSRLPVATSLCRGPSCLSVARSEPAKRACSRARGLVLVSVCCASVALGWTPTVVAQSVPASRDTTEVPAIRTDFARFYEGWNAHDVAQMVSVYADDVDQVNVFAEWHRGKQAIADDLRRFHAGPAKNSRKTYTVEKIRFIKPDVAVVQVRSLSAVGNLGTYVMVKESGDWRTVSFTNVGYALRP